MSVKKACPFCGEAVTIFGPEFERHKRERGHRDWSDIVNAPRVETIDHVALVDLASNEMLACSGPIERGEVDLARIMSIKLEGLVIYDEAEQKARRDIPGLG